ncbi:MAG: endonuclease III, partial [Bacteroidetes bacterium]|nr:endonuclease III [Bacteroidota bacterium]
MTKKERFQKVLDYFANHNPSAETELKYSNPYELLVAVILSAQCTDKRINMVTPALFSRFPDAETMAEASQAEVFNYIRSVSYPNNKAKSLVGMAKML